MSRKNLAELEADLLKLKEREIKIKEELALQRKAADEKAQKERSRKMYQLAEIVVENCGEEILNRREDFEIFIQEHIPELKEFTM